jgi:uncharacterized spore protein YtfJ
MTAEDNIKATIDELQKVLSANNIIGTPIEMEDKIIVPITKMGMGFGTGSSQCGDNKAGGTSGGAGGGVGVFPVAVVIVSKGVAGHEGVKVVPLGTPKVAPLGTSNFLSESLGDIASVLMERFSKKKESSEEKHHNPTAVSVEVK